ncbi:MAG TPA: NAD(P)/FAD-dependent oxidoreductase [Mycobacterium sp.]|nr:NAD(P)/FAD-dependent oxidoreductase [Mycobacterium sp.]
MARDAGESVDAVVIGAGHNGLVAASMLADAGWDVLVLEAQPEPGGAVRSAELTPGYVTDLYSSFYPMTAASPAMAALHLEDHGLRWSHAPAVVAHPRNGADDDIPVVHRDPARTATELERAHPGDGENWWRLVQLWQTVKKPFVDAILAPFPPVRPVVQLLRALGTSEAMRLANLVVQPANSMASRLFGGEAAQLLLLGNAMHADAPPDAPGSGAFGFLLMMLAQDVGWPVPVGGSGKLTAALVDRAYSAGAHIECEQNVSRIHVRGGRAVAVSTAQGRTVRVRRAIVADVTAPRLFCDMLPRDAIPAGLLREFDHYTWDPPVVKVNYTLSEPIPWRSQKLAGVGTVHRSPGRRRSAAQIEPLDRCLSAPHPGRGTEDQHLLQLRGAAVDCTSVQVCVAGFQIRRALHEPADHTVTEPGGMFFDDPVHRRGELLGRLVVRDVARQMRVSPDTFGALR